MAETRFNMRYDGPVVQQGRMDVRDLAPALLAMADLVREASEVLFPNDPPPTVDIRATNGGSFLIELALAEAHLVERVLEVFRSSKGAAIALGSILTLTMGAIQTAIALEGRLVNRRSEQGQEDLVTLHLDGVTLSVPADQADLLERPGFWKAAKGIAQPLDDGITSLEVAAPSIDPIRVTTEKKRHLDRPLFGPVVTESQSRVLLSLIQVSFSEGRKWKFTDGDAEFFCSIEDHNFITQVMLGQKKFGAGDRLDSELMVRQSMAADGTLKTERIIRHVLAHTPGPRQQTFTYAEDEQES